MGVWVYAAQLLHSRRERAFTAYSDSVWLADNRAGGEEHRYCSPDVRSSAVDYSQVQLSKDKLLPRDQDNTFGRRQERVIRINRDFITSGSGQERRDQGPWKKMVDWRKPSFHLWNRNSFRWNSTSPRYSLSKLPASPKPMKSWPRSTRSRKWETITSSSIYLIRYIIHILLLLPLAELYVLQ